MIKTIIVALTYLVVSSCTSQPAILPDTPIVVPQDVEGCINDPLTPWCQAACKNPKYEWCETHETI